MHALEKGATMSLIELLVEKGSKEMLMAKDKVRV